MTDVTLKATSQTMNLVNTVALNQKQLIRLQLAAQIVAAWETGNDTLCTEEMNTTMSKQELVNLAVDYADLLIQRIVETADRV